MSEIGVRKLNRKVIIALILFAAAAMLLGIYANIAKRAAINKTASVSATVLQQPRDIIPFALTDNSGKPFTNKNLEGHWTFMFFGFTNCPHICPTTMTELNRMYNALASDKIKSMPQVMMVSIDPERDSVSRINQYVKVFNEAFIGATGKQQEIDALTKQLGIVHMKVANKDNKSQGNYDIDHSGTIMLFNPQGELAAFFSMPHDAAKMAQDFEVISNQA